MKWLKNGGVWAMQEIGWGCGFRADRSSSGDIVALMTGVAYRISRRSGLRNLTTD
jgi:hypothetical protein